MDDLTFGTSTNFASSIPSGGLSLGIVTDQLSVFIRALEAVTDVAVLANPKVLVLNKQSGHVLVGSRDGYLSTLVATDATSTQSVAFLETGTQLQFQPFISSDGFVRLNVTPSDSTGGVNANGLPFEKTTEVTSNILVRDGHTVLIGGLFREVDSTGRSQVPLLGSIPILGQAFGSTSDSTIREEVIILLTVHIVEDEDLYAAYSEQVREDIERIRIGVRDKMQWHGRQKLAQANYHIALEHATKGNTGRALWYAKLAIHNRPAFIEAIKLREELMQERAWDSDNSLCRNFLHSLVLRQKGLPEQHFGRPMTVGQEAPPLPTPDECPDDPNKVAPGICGCGVPDDDSDGDGVADCLDGCPEDAEKIAPGACDCGTPDSDSDQDGTPDCHDGCPDDPEKTTPGVCGCGIPDTDSDGDTTPDCSDGCPNDPQKVAPGICGCGAADTDSDEDGTADCSDRCPNDASKTAPGECGCGTPDTDADDDGAADCMDRCPEDPAKVTPGDCGCGSSDDDTDGDGTADCIDACPDDAEKTSPGQCGCGTADTDRDGDGTADCNDGCPDDPDKTAPGDEGCAATED